MQMCKFQMLNDFKADCKFIVVIFMVSG